MDNIGQSAVTIQVKRRVYNAEELSSLLYETDEYSHVFMCCVC